MFECYTGSCFGAVVQYVLVALTKNIMDVKNKLKAKLTAKLANVSNVEHIASWISKEYGDKLQNITVTGQSMKWLIVTERNIGHTNPVAVQLHICSDKTFQLKVLGLVKEEGTWSSSENDEQLKCVLNKMNSQDYALCQGITDYEDYFKQLGYDAKGIRKWVNKRVDADECLLWHPFQRTNKEEYNHLCANCVHLKYRLKRLLKKSVAAGTPKKRASVHPSSRRPLKYMSPRSKLKRRFNQNQERNNFKKLLKRMKGTDVDLNDEQNKEMSKVTAVIQKDHDSELNRFIDEASGQNEKKKREMFEKDQTKNVTGSRGNKWNTITYRIALAVYIRSPTRV